MRRGWFMAATLPPSFTSKADRGTCSAATLKKSPARTVSALVPPFVDDKGPMDAPRNSSPGRRRLALHAWPPIDLCTGGLGLLFEQHLAVRSPENQSVVRIEDAGTSMAFAVESQDAVVLRGNRGVGK